MGEDKNFDNVSHIVKYSTEQFDKNTLFIASGALGVSFAFIKDIIPDLKNAVCKWYLISSWYTFAAVIFVCLMGHFVAILAANWAIKNHYLSDKEYNRKIKRWNIPIRTLNISTIIGIFIGALMLIHFINQNIAKL